MIGCKGSTLQAVKTLVTNKKNNYKIYIQLHLAMFKKIFPPEVKYFLKH